jgi:hypothetical protein
MPDGAMDEACFATECAHSLLAFVAARKDSSIQLEREPPVDRVALLQQRRRLALLREGSLGRAR